MSQARRAIRSGGLEMPRNRGTLLAASLVCLTLVAAACGNDSDAGDGDGDYSTRRVPDDYDTIQDAVDAAEPGDLVLVAPQEATDDNEDGSYREAVTVPEGKDDLVIRGTDRNKVIVDGEFERENGIFVVSDGVAVENMTARNFKANGFFWSGVEGYRGSYLTAYRNGDYGIYAFDAVDGQFDNSYASGSPDAGFYIGQCFPCNAVVDNVVSEYNGLGYSGTNAGGDLYLVNSTWRNNRAGIVPNSGSYELCYPQRATTIVGNLVYDNNYEEGPAISVARLATWNGILVAGGYDNVIERNLIYDHDRTGIGLVPFPEEDAVDDVPTAEELALPCSGTRDQTPDEPRLVIWDSVGNRIVGNDVSASGLADLAMGSLDEAAGVNGNCFADNTFSTSAPADIETLAPCEGEGAGDPSAGALDLGRLIDDQGPEGGDYRETPIPEDQPNMPDAESAPPRPATDVPMPVDIEAITVPARPG